MNATDLVLQFIDALNSAGAQYMLVGSFSSNYYGRPRLTKDADFVVEIDTAQLAAVMAKLGPDFQIDRQMSFETVTMSVRYIVYHRSSAFKIELFQLSPDLHDHERFGRRRQVDFEGRPVWLPTAEDVIITKLRWARAGERSKDKADVAQVLSIRGKALDLNYIRHWTDQHGTRDLFEQLLASTSG